MAIYHCSLRSFSREKGHSAVAAAAYRSGENLKDERTGRFHNYQNRKGVADTFILLPGDVGDTYSNRITLWNAAESSETRKNSRVAREVILALPYELTDKARLSLTRDMAAYLVEKYRVAVDAAIHTPVEKDGHDRRNHHAHLLFTTRELSSEGFGKKTRILDDREQGPVQVELIRDVWETLANEALKAAGFETRIDKRSLEDQGVDRIPQTHIGNAAVHADEEAEQEDSKDDEEDDGETGEGGKSGSGDTGTVAPSLAAKEPDQVPKKEPEARKEIKEPKAREVDNKSIDKGQTRFQFVEEIKKLNEQRAAFSDIPLKAQIEQIDELMDRLDGRLEKLKTISDKTSLPERIKVAVISLFIRAREALIVREDIRHERTLSEAEKEAKAERQQARYGKTYRAGIHEQIREMRENIQVLKTKEVEYRKYDSFVSLIERRVEQIRAEKGFLPPLPIKPEWAQKVTTVQAVQSKIGIEAKQAKEKIPPELKPKVETEKLAAKFESARAEKPLQPDSKPEKVSKEVAPSKLEKPFNAASKTALKADNVNEVKSVPAKQAEPSKVDKTIISSNGKSAGKNDWKIEGNEKTKPFTDKIEREIRAAKAETVRKEAADNLREAFNNPKPEPKTTTNEEVLSKVRKEAQAAREKVPPEYRAEPYAHEPEPFYTENTASTPQQEAWQAAAGSAETNEGFEKPKSSEEPIKKPRSKMSSAFNKAAFNTEDQPPIPDNEIKPNIHPK